jgi:RNase adapter protein RapZ
MNTPAGAPPSTDDGSGGGPAQRETVVLISGISGSGKSVALNALEDAGYFCVDNLPPELLREFIWLEHSQFARRVAVAIDVRTSVSLPLVLPLIDQLRSEGIAINSLFLDSRTETLVRRFSETRRRHPLSAHEEQGVTSRAALTEAIERERGLLSGLREVSTVIDTSDLRPTQLRAWIRQLAGAGQSSLTLVFESFAFKHGVPRDADLVFDLRVLPNPHYVRELRPLTGRDAAVAAYLDAQPEVAEMLSNIEAFLSRWLPAFDQDQRSYLTVALGCTGGQHRSVYSAERLATRFAAKVPTLVRHRELEAREDARSE